MSKHFRWHKEEGGAIKREPQLVRVGTTAMSAERHHAKLAIQFFLDGDLADTATPFVARQSEGMSLQLRQSHGWLNGFLDASSLDDARKRYEPGNKSTWPHVFPDASYVFVDRHGKLLPGVELRVKIGDVREVRPAASPELSLLFVRWGGRHRIGEDEEGDHATGRADPPWGLYGAPPSDWYMEAVVTRGVVRHPKVGVAERSVEVVSLFLGSNADMRSMRIEASQLAALLLGRTAASWWMLWGADFPTAWEEDSFLGYVNRRDLFASQRALEATGRVLSAFPHPADLWEFITSKVWMATLAPQCETMRLPACVMLERAAILNDARGAARSAMMALEELRRKNRRVWPEGPAAVNRRGLTRGVLKIGWSWEAKFVWFWRGEAQLAEYIRAMITLPGCTSDFCLVQEWVDFDFEVRLFFLPRRDWTPDAPLQPTHVEYTAWVNERAKDAPDKFIKMGADEALSRFAADAPALASALEQATEASRPLVGELLTKHAVPVPMIRMDWMVKRTGMGAAQVVFGEYCEVGADCLKWQAGPPKIWRAALDCAFTRAGVEEPAWSGKRKR
jgi:hypothetical protein